MDQLAFGRPVIGTIAVKASKFIDHRTGGNPPELEAHFPNRECQLQSEVVLKFKVIVQ